MQTYGSAFAKVYNRRWSGFAQHVAPLVKALYERTCPQDDKSLLDLCCGTGQLAIHFLKHGYRVVGIDASEAMLKHARENAKEQGSDARTATFLKADATKFTLDNRCGLVVSTYDSLNHIADEQSLRQCFQSVFNVCQRMFVFDLNTRLGLRRWNGINIDDSEDDLLLINRGIYDGDGDRAWTRITGFCRTQDALFERFDETISNTVFAMKRVRQLLVDVGWHDVYFASIGDLSARIEDPESLGRAFVISLKR